MRNSMRSSNPKFIVTILAAVMTVQSPFVPTVAAQENKVRLPLEKTSPRLDLIENAASLAFSAGREASALPNPDERIEMQVKAAEILALVRPDDAVRLLDMAWLSLRQWSEGDSLSARQRYHAIELRGDLLALYAKLVPERINKLVASLPDNALNGVSNNGQNAGNNPPLPTERQAADEIINIGFTRFKQNPAETVEAAISSVQKTGKVSEYLSSVAEALYEQGNEPLLRAFENRLAELLSATLSLDPLDQRAVAFLLSADPQMSPTAQSVFLGFLLRSLQKLVAVIREAQISKQPPVVDSDTNTFSHSIYTSNIRPLFVKYLPRQIERFDTLLGEIAAALPPSYLDSIYESSTTDAIEDQLARARQTNDKSLRNSRLLSFTFRALAGRLPATQERQLEFAVLAVEEIEDAGTKAILGDYILMAGIKNLTTKNDFAVAAEKALKISKTEWRAWTLMAVATAQIEQNSSVALQLYDEALRHLEKSSPSPRKVEFAFLATELLSQYDQLRAFEALAVAIKYANQMNDSSRTITTQLPDLNKFFPHVGKLSMAPGDEPGNLNQLGVSEGIGRLAFIDWIRAEQIGKTIQNPGLRLRYQLAMAKGVLAKAKGEAKVAGVQ